MSGSVARATCRRLPLACLVVLLTACPQKTAVWISRGATAANLVFHFGKEPGKEAPVAVGGVHVRTCADSVGECYPRCSTAACPMDFGRRSALWLCNKDAILLRSPEPEEHGSRSGQMIASSTRAARGENYDDDFVVRRDPFAWRDQRV
jgi:hypothetical protein